MGLNVMMPASLFVPFQGGAHTAWDQRTRRTSAGMVHTGGLLPLAPQVWLTLVTCYTLPLRYGRHRWPATACPSGMEDTGDLPVFEGVHAMHHVWGRAALL